jgi:hypothetical protein
VALAGSESKEEFLARARGEVVKLAEGMVA